MQLFILWIPYIYIRLGQFNQIFVRRFKKSLHVNQLESSIILNSPKFQLLGHWSHLIAQESTFLILSTKLLSSPEGDRTRKAHSTSLLTQQAWLLAIYYIHQSTLGSCEKNSPGQSARPKFLTGNPLQANSHIT